MASGSRFRHSEPRERRPRLGSHPLPRNERRDRPHRQVRHHDVFGDAHGRAEGEFLVDDDDARRTTVQGRGESRRLAVDPDLALVRRKFSRQDVDQGRLAGAILADDRMHLSAAKSHGDMIKRDDAGEPFGDPGYLDDFVVTIRHGVRLATAHASSKAFVAERYFLATSAMFSFV